MLLTTSTIPENFRRIHNGITVHGLLASFLAFGGANTSCYSAWKKSWPSMQEFQETMPILWPSFMREPLGSGGDPHPRTCRREDSTFILPPAISGRWAYLHALSRIRNNAPIYRQEEKLKADWYIVSKAFPNETFLAYTYYWLIVNTRSFYFETSSGVNAKDRDDRMVLCPFVDYFNHNDHGVSCLQ